MMYSLKNDQNTDKDELVGLLGLTVTVRTLSTESLLSKTKAAPAGGSSDDGVRASPQRPLLGRSTNDTA